MNSCLNMTGLTDEVEIWSFPDEDDAYLIGEFDLFSFVFSLDLPLE